MAQRSLSDAGPSAREDMRQSWPFFTIVSLVMMGGYVSALSSLPALKEPLRLAFFTALMLVHGGLYWAGPHLARTKRHIVVYCVAQGALAFTIGLLTLGHWLVLGLYPALAGLSVAAFWPNWRVSALAAVICFGLLTFNLIASFGFQEFVRTLPFIGIMLAFVFVYVVLFVRQVDARERAQKLLGELETAHRQLQAYAERVGELTIGQERERMARELHDTLAQGLAGLILQLEAADSHLESGSASRAQAVVQQAMQQARTTLDEARRAIQALRPAALERGGLVDALGQEVDRFADATGIQAAFEVEADALDVSPEAAQDILRIVQESLSNVARHAGAGRVWVWLGQEGDRLRVVVRDDGAGFDPATGLEQPDRFGLAGMEERARRLGGRLRVESERRKGTIVTLEVGEG